MKLDIERQRRMSYIGLLVGALLACLSSRTHAGQEKAPVMLGGRPDFPACSAIGHVFRLGPRRADDPKSGFLSVRSGPGGSAYFEMDRTYNGQELFVCDTIGPWLAVVYAQPGQSRRVCGDLTAIVAVRQVYRGPCRSGWVHHSYVEITAG
jgi:hypothetical protein